MKFTRRSALLATIAAGCLLAPAAAVVSLPTAMAQATQSGSTSLTPQIVQNGATPASADSAQISGTVTFRPIRKGRPVIIQRRLPGGSWSNVASGRQNGAGQFRFTGPAKLSLLWYSYRGVAKRYNGLPAFTTAATDASTWSMKFEDEFAGEQLSDKWRVRAEGEYAPQSNRACSASYSDAVSVGGGRVALWVKHDRQRQTALGRCDRYYKRDSLSAQWFRNGHISSGRHFSFKYGVAAARVKFDRNVGAHGAFWLQSTVQDRNGIGPFQDGAEIDTVEYFGKDFKQGDVYSFIHYRDSAGKHHKVPEMQPITAARQALKRDDDWFKRYHVFSVEWSSTGYLFRVDGIPTLRINQGVSGVNEFLILSMLTSDWELPRLNVSTLPNAMEVDWVRVWQRS